MTWKYFKGKENLTNKLLSQGMKLATTLVRPLLGRQLHNLVQRNSIGISPRRPRGGAVYASGESVNLVVIGDSTVNGSGISCRSLTLGGQLAKALSARTRRTVHWTVMAAGGITPARVHDKYLPKLPAQNPDVVVIGLGGNCIVKLSPPSEWTEASTKIIDGIRGLVGGVPIILTAMPPVTKLKAIPQPLRFCLAVNGKVLNAKTKQLARAHSGVYFGPGYEAHKKEYLGPDGCHPSTLGYAAWSEKLTDTIVPLLPVKPPLYKSTHVS